MNEISYYLFGLFGLFLVRVHIKSLIKLIQVFHSLTVCFHLHKEVIGRRDESIATLSMLVLIETFLT